jgi:hypothetical protein
MRILPRMDRFKGSVTRRDFVRTALAGAAAAQWCVSCAAGAEERSAVATRPASASNTDWMRTGQYGLFMHYQYCIPCNREGGVCTLDWPCDPKTGLLKDFGFAQLQRVARAVKGR